MQRLPKRAPATLHATRPWKCTGTHAACRDAGRLAQLLQNLIGNALQHGSNKRDVMVTLKGEPQAVRLTVHNFGAPIPEERHGHDLQSPGAQRRTKTGPAFNQPRVGVVYRQGSGERA